MSDPTQIILFERIVDIGDAVQRIEQTLSIADVVALRGALQIVSLDMHATSTRPCSTCQTVSAVLGEPFGCDARRKKVQSGT